MDECIHKMWYTHIVDYYLVIKRDEVLIHAREYKRTLKTSCEVTEASHKGHI